LYTIHLHQLEFFAFHGLYEEERVVGNKFVVSVDVDFESNHIITSISDTIDYTLIYEIIKKRMVIPTGLIEIVAEDIISGIHEKFGQVKQIKISIQKSNPPIISFKGNVGLSLQKNF
jgi:dihydroneopterin aldolase